MLGPALTPLSGTYVVLSIFGQRMYFSTSFPFFLFELSSLSACNSLSFLPRAEEEHHNCCWKAFHTDPNGAWYKPHKAGPITGFFLVIGWILFIIFFGWIVALALVLVFILVIFAYILNFICTGRCQIDEDED